MSELPLPSSLQSFLADLVSIRQKSQVSLDDIRVKTKVYPHIIKQFETDALSDHPLFNDLYVKAFIRSYSKVVGIDPENTVTLFEKAKDGVYGRELAVKHLGYELSPREKEAFEAQRNRHEKHNQNAASEVSEGKDQGTRRSDVSPAASIDAQNQSSERPSPRRTEKAKGSLEVMLQASQENGFVQWAILAGCIIVGLIIIFQIVARQSIEMAADDSQSTTIQETSVANKESSDTDSLSQLEGALDTSQITAQPAVDETLSQVQKPVRPVVLEDSLGVVIIAETGKLDPFRVRIDADLRRPYWLEEGDSMRFLMGQQIIVEDNLQAMKILLEGEEYPIHETDSTARVTITRDSVLAFLNSVR